MLLEVCSASKLSRVTGRNNAVDKLKCADMQTPPSERVPHSPGSLMFNFSSRRQALWLGNMLHTTSVFDDEDTCEQCIWS